jgi:hypothetical protein
MFTCTLNYISAIRLLGRQDVGKGERLRRAIGLFSPRSPRLRVVPYFVRPKAD